MARANLENNCMAKTLLSNTTPTRDEIAARAYEIYLRDGAVAGRDLDHWLQAEAELRNGNGNGNAPIEHELTQVNGADGEKANAMERPATGTINPTAPRSSSGRRTTKR